MLQILPQGKHVDIITTEKYNKSRAKILLALDVLTPLNQTQLTKYDADSKREFTKVVNVDEGIGRLKSFQMILKEQFEGGGSGGYRHAIMWKEIKGTLLCGVFVDLPCLQSMQFSWLVSG